MLTSVDTVLSAPGVYRRPSEAAAGFPRERTDVVGFVGVAGASRLGEVVRIDDWRSYEEVYLRDAAGASVAPPAGAQLRDAVRAFFVNGGSRCWVVNIGAEIKEANKADFLDQMLGFSNPTGLELLLGKREVAIVVLPELEAWLTREVKDEYNAPILDQGRFGCCADLLQVPPLRSTSTELTTPLFTPAEVLAAQRAAIDRVGRVKWRAFLLLTAPAGLTPDQVSAWRVAVAHNRADADAAALYYPWVLAADKPGQAPRLQPPLGFVAGIFARRDLARGPHVAPANEALHSVCGVQRTLADEDHGRLNAAAVNVIRPYPNRGIELWGARTLAFGRPKADIGELGYVNVRRCLSALERNCDFIGQRIVFEPNQPMTRFVLAQVITRYLLSVFKAGAFKGAEPESCFFVRCDESNNPAAVVDAGQLICEVGIVIAVPSEFIIFRLGRRDGVVEIQEQH